MRWRLLVLTTGLALVAAMAMPAAAYWPVRDETTTTLHTAELGAPRVTITPTGTTLTLRIAAPNTGPTPSGYVVRYTEGDQTHQVCELTEPGACTDQIGTPATTRTYTVSATLGSHWERSITIRAAAPAPLRLSDLVLANGTGTPGRADAGDTVTWTFDRPVDPQSVCAVWGRIPGGAHHLNVSVVATATSDDVEHTDEQAVLTVTPSPSDACGDSTDNALHLGRLQIPDAYLSGDVLTFAESSLEVSADHRSITLTLGASDEGAAEQPVPATVPTFVPAVPGPTDQDGAALRPSATSGTSSTF